MNAQLSAYLERIRYTGPLAPTLRTLQGLHRAHLLAIPYENLDIHFGRRLSLDGASVFHKLVTERRGGWCYEMNSLFAWALGELGFTVRLLAGAVDRSERGDAALFNHLVLLVSLPQPYLADVGFGNGFREPLPLRVGEHRQRFLRYRLERLGQYWRFHNYPGGGPSFDFTLTGYALTDFAAQCHELQTAPESGFVRTTVCQRFTPDGIVTLRGAVLTTVTAGGVQQRVLEDEAAYGRVLEQVFGLAVDSATLWRSVWPRHVAWAAEQARAAAQ